MPDPGKIIRNRLPSHTNLKDKFIICAGFLVEMPLQKLTAFDIMVVVIIPAPGGFRRWR